jgi:hypothetical protein
LLVLGLMAAHVGMLGLSLGIEALYQRHWWMVMAFLGSAYAITRKPSVKAFRLLVNRSVSWADWDEELLALELQDLSSTDIDLS